VASVWIRSRPTKAGEARYRVEYRVGGRDTPTQFAGSFRTKRLATVRAAWVERELAELRVPDLTITDAEAMSPTFEVAAQQWLDARIEVANGTKIQNRTSINRALKVIGNKRLEDLDAHDVADMVVRLHGEGVAVGYCARLCRRSR
jgi:hypothetical protein